MVRVTVEELQKRILIITHQKLEVRNLRKEQRLLNIFRQHLLAKKVLKRYPVSQMRKTIAKRLVDSKFTSPHFYLTMSIDMDKAVESRAKLNETSPVKISFNDIVLKACAVALKQHPAVNSSWLGDTIRRNHHVHIGVAVAVEDGLLVPVVKFADTKSLSQIAAEVKSLHKKRRIKNYNQRTGKEILSLFPILACLASKNLLPSLILPIHVYSPWVELRKCLL